MQYRNYLDSPVGVLEIVSDKQNILAINFVKKIGQNSDNTLGTKCVVQLNQYFKSKRKKFDLPIKLAGTNWQNKVWLALSKIPYGSVISYSDLAKMVGNPLASRAIGQAVNKNKIPIIIPCHRVVGATGRLVGYAGGLKNKKYLISLENSVNF
ncbi:methylated-DNA--[protein]-cysteine S-methyltransferase [Patescibacteria group bacterium]|nr:methylated-DNA--[protein]-cysteine S-methyltransferase [Patescibacteria group bacterium]